MHLGIDIWAEAGQKVYLPWSGRLVSARNNSGQGDYGPTLIMEHEVNDRIIYSLYGHLSIRSLDHPKNARLKKGQHIADIGESSVNGGWLPHLHFQLITELDGMYGDYPGVCKLSDWDRYQVNCPDPGTFGICPKVDSP